MQKASLLVVAEAELHDVYRHLPLGGKVQIIVPGKVIAMLHKEKWDLVFLDAGSDPAFALELLHQIKSSIPAVPVLFLTETGSEDLILNAFRLGARDYLRRPFDVVRLKAWVDNLLALRRNGGERRVCVHLNEDLSGPIGEPGEEPYIPPNILRVLAHIDEHLRESLCLEAMAREAGLSTHYFCRTFRELLGMSPMRFVCYQRVQKAKRLLLRDDLNISAVATKSGFGNLNNLNKWFKVFEGTTPSRYCSRTRLARHH
jgi:AraC-like DNA-binding protein/CheY-like chemotaxis protein